MRERFEQLKARAEMLFVKNTRTQKGYRFVVPSHNVYHSQFGWDSGFHAIAAKYFDEELARSELLALFSNQQADGRIPHEVVIRHEQIKDPARLLIQLFFRDSFENGVSCFIDPPTYVYAVWDVYSYTHDRNFLQTCYPALKKTMEYLARRDGFGDGLVSIVHPLESGTDDSPAFDGPIYGSNKTLYDPVRRYSRCIRLMKKNRSGNWDFERLRRRNLFIFEDVLFNTLYIKALECMKLIATELGDTEGGNAYRTHAAVCARELEKMLWDERDEIFYPRYDPENPRFSKALTLSNISPMFLSGIDREKRKAMIKRYLKSPDHFWTPYKASFNSVSALNDGKRWINRGILWRGACVWMNLNWLLVCGLLEFDEHDLATQITESSVEMILNNGFYEYYNAFTGRGAGASDFTWGALALDMIKRSGLS